MDPHICMLDQHIMCNQMYFFIIQIMTNVFINKTDLMCVISKAVAANLSVNFSDWCYLHEPPKLADNQKQFYDMVFDW